jgi:hypothetical protein
MIIAPKSIKEKSEKVLGAGEHDHCSKEYQSEQAPKSIKEKTEKVCGGGLM